MSRFDTATIVRFAAMAFAVLAISLAAIELGRDEPGVSGPGVVSIATPAADPLAAELARCRAMTDPAQVDDGCRRAWAERRARFFGQPEARR